MNTGLFGEGFPYSNFHDLNLDWIIKIAKNFLDQYTHIQDIIAQGLEDLQNTTDEGIESITNKTTESLDSLNTEYNRLLGLLDTWYQTHSEDIHDELANALATINAELTTVLTTLNNSADTKLSQVLASIPSDYTSLANDVVYLQSLLNGFYTQIPLTRFVDGTIGFDGSGRTSPKLVASNTQQIAFFYNCPALAIEVISGTLAILTLNRETGAWSSAETFVAGAIAVKNNLTDYIVIHTGTITDSMNVYAMFDNYDTGAENYSHLNPHLVNNMANKQFYQVKASNRISTGIFTTNDLRLSTEDSSQRCMIFYTDSSGNWNFSDWTQTYNRKTTNPYQCVLLFKKTDDSDIDENDLVQYYIAYGMKTKSVDVIHFTVKVSNQSGTSYTDEAILVLPENYEPNGEPVRLAVVCHGSSVSRYGTAEMDANGKILGDPQRVLTKMGYAVMDTFAAPYGLFGSYSGLHYGCPIVLPCYKSAIDYVLQNYNVKKTGISVFGSSMGALPALQITYLSNFDVSSCVLYSPCVELYKQAWCNPWANTTRYSIAHLFNFAGTEPTFGNTFPPSEAEKTYFLNNINKTMGMNGITMNADFFYRTLCEVFPTTATGLDETAEATEYNKYKKFIKTPLLMFHCKDDTIVAYRYTEYIHNMLKAGGSYVTLVSFDTGGHNAWATGEDVTLYDVNGNAFTCKYSQAQGYRWARAYGRE